VAHDQYKEAVNATVLAVPAADAQLFAAVVWSTFCGGRRASVLQVSGRLLSLSLLSTDAL
jgi:hypothetical protein